MATLGGVTYDRLPGYPQERITKQSIEVMDRLQCDYGDRITLSKYLLGFTAGSVVQPPQEYDFGDDPILNIFCRDVQVDPLDDLKTKAVLDVTYGNLSYDQPDTGTVYYTESLEPASEFLTLSVKNDADEAILFWDNAQAEPLSDAEKPSKVIRMVDWVYTLHHLSYIPAFVFTHPGTINNASVYSRSLNATFAAGTLLCGNPTMSREISSEGITTWTITVRMTYKKETWQYFPRSTDTGDLVFGPLYDTGGNLKGIYDFANFNSIVI